MKFAAVVLTTLKILQVYRVWNSISTATEVSLAMVPSWIRILVRPIKRASSSSSKFVSCPSLHPDLYSKLCTIEVDLSHLWNTSNIQTLPKRLGHGVYYNVDFDVVMLFGGTEIRAQLSWKENVRSVIFENWLLCWGLTIPTPFFYILLGCREEVMIFSSLCLTF